MSIRMCEEKQKEAAVHFASLPSNEAKYEEIIKMGKLLSPLDASDKIAENKVHGCQSTMYLKSEYNGKTIHFTAESDALISSGLAALLLSVYQDQDPQTILKCPPLFLDEIGMSSLISPSRANGLYSLHLLMKQKALHYLINQ